MTPSALWTLLTLIASGHGTSFVPSIDRQWPWYQWTTPRPTAQSGPTTTTERPLDHTWPNTPPPPVTVLPPLNDNKFLIVTDPSDGRTFYVPANLFWERFTGLNDHRPIPQTNQIQCDISSPNCWLRNTPSLDTGFRQSAYWKPTSKSHQVPEDKRPFGHLPSWDDESGAQMTWTSGHRDSFPLTRMARTQGTGIGGGKYD